jgi:hypothetical protein
MTISTRPGLHRCVCREFSLLRGGLRCVLHRISFARPPSETFKIVVDNLFLFWCLYCNMFSLFDDLLGDTKSCPSRMLPKTARLMLITCCGSIFCMCSDQQTDPPVDRVRANMLPHSPRTHQPNVVGIFARKTLWIDTTPKFVSTIGAVRWK